MLPLSAASSAGAAIKPPQPATAQTAIRTAQPQAPETARASAGEAAAANVRTETPIAIQAAEQSAVAPRLRDQETADKGYVNEKKKRAARCLPNRASPSPL